jgi:hypothetical protein
MPRHREAMKDVAACDKLRGGGKQPLIRRFPNGATLLIEDQKLRLRSGSKLGEVKHLSSQRKIKKIDSLSSGERTGKSLNSSKIFLKFMARVVGTYLALV